MSDSPNNLPDPLKMPAFMRRRSLAKKAAEIRLLLTAFDRKKAGLLKEKKPLRDLVLATALDRKKAGRLLEPRKKNKKQLKIKLAKRPALVYSAPADNFLPDDSFQPIVTQPSWQKLGIVTHFFEKISVGVIRLHGDLRSGQEIMIGQVRQTVASMQINRIEVQRAYVEDEVGVKLVMKPTVGDIVYILI